MGFFSKLFKGPEIDMEKSRRNAEKMRLLFNQAVENGDAYRLIFGYTEDVSRFNYGFVHGSRTKIGNLIVGWNEDSQTIAVVPTVPDLSGCGTPVCYRRSEILKAYRNKYPTDAFIIYPDKKGYIGINAYDWLEDEPGRFYPGDVDHVHAPERMGQLSSFISINGGVQLDLMGQENAESVGSRQLSGIGGQMDFLEGAFRSKGGRGYICLNSSRRDKEGKLRSNIVPTIPGGSTISVPRTMIECVATEYGVAHLAGLSLGERAAAMASIAHPDFREELARYARDNFR